MADNGGQLLLAVYNTVTKSYLTDNRFDDKVKVLYTHSYQTVIIMYHFRYWKILKNTFSHLGLKVTMMLVPLHCIPGLFI